MAATPKGPQKVKIDYSIDKAIYKEFMQTCTRKGYAPKVIVEQMMKKYNKTGQV